MCGMMMIFNPFAERLHEWDARHPCRQCRARDYVRMSATSRALLELRQARPALTRSHDLTGRYDLSLNAGDCAVISCMNDLLSAAFVDLLIGLRPLASGQAFCLGLEWFAFQPNVRMRYAGVSGVTPIRGLGRAFHDGYEHSFAAVAPHHFAHCATRAGG